VGRIRASPRPSLAGKWTRSALAGSIIGFVYLHDLRSHGLRRGIAVVGRSASSARSGHTIRTRLISSFSAKARTLPRRAAPIRGQSFDRALGAPKRRNSHTRGAWGTSPGGRQRWWGRSLIAGAAPHSRGGSWMVGRGEGRPGPASATDALGLRSRFRACDGTGGQARAGRASRGRDPHEAGRLGDGGRSGR